MFKAKISEAAVRIWRSTTFKISRHQGSEPLMVFARTGEIFVRDNANDAAAPLSTMITAKLKTA